MEHKQSKRSANDREQLLIAHEQEQRDKNCIERARELKGEYDHWADILNPFSDNVWADARSNLARPDRRSFRIEVGEYYLASAAIDETIGYILQDAEERGFAISGQKGDDDIIIGNTKNDVSDRKLIFPKRIDLLGDAAKMQGNATTDVSKLVTSLVKRALESGCFDGARVDFDTPAQCKEFSRLSKELFEKGGLKFHLTGSNGSHSTEIQWGDAKMKHQFRISYKECEEAVYEARRRKAH